jgi:hypothetical protein
MRFHWKTMSTISRSEISKGNASLQPSRFLRGSLTGGACVVTQERGTPYARRGGSPAQRASRCQRGQPALVGLRHAARRAPHAQRSHTNAGAAATVSSVSRAHEKHLQRASQALTSALVSRQ